MMLFSKLSKVIKEPSLLRAYLEWKLFPIFLKYTRRTYAAPPHGLSIAMNNTCNLKCLMCDIGQKRNDLAFSKTLNRPDDMTLDQFRNLIDSVKSFKPVIYINATEPLLYPSLIECLEYAIAQGLKCSITTNGLLLEKFAPELIRIKLPEIWVSIDGPAMIHDTIRGVTGSWHKACRGIATLVEARKFSSPIIGVAYCISNHNFDYLVETAQLFKKAGVDRMVFSHLNFINKNMADTHNGLYVNMITEHSEIDYFDPVLPSSTSACNANKVDTDILFNQIIELKKDKFASFLPDLSTKEQLETYYHDPNKFVISNRCKVAWRSSQILSNGDVIVAARCAFSPIMGNINKKPLTAIWNDKPYKEFRRRINIIGATPACARCCSLFGR